MNRKSEKMETAAARLVVAGIMLEETEKGEI
jgi:hypothetical protein